MSERKVTDAIFAQRDAPRRARVSWIPQAHGVREPKRLESPFRTQKPGLADAAPRDPVSAPQEAPSETPVSLEGAPSSEVEPAPSPSPAEPSPSSVRGFFDALPEMPPPPELMPSTDVQAAVESFVQAAEALSEIRALRHSRVERDLVELARAIAVRIIGREISTDPSLLVALARDGISALADRENVTVRFSATVPEDVRTQLTDAVSHRAPGCTVLFDSELVSGSCVVESAQGYVDESVGTRLDVVMEQLGFGGGGME